MAQSALGQGTNSRSHFSTLQTPLKTLLQISEFMLAGVCLCCYKYKYLSAASSITIHNKANWSASSKLRPLKARAVPQPHLSLPSSQFLVLILPVLFTASRQLPDSHILNSPCRTVSWSDARSEKCWFTMSHYPKLRLNWEDQDWFKLLNKQSTWSRNGAWWTAAERDSPAKEMRPAGQAFNFLFCWLRVCSFPSCPGEKVPLSIKIIISSKQMSQGPAT